MPPTIKATAKEDHDKAPLQQVNTSDVSHISNLLPTENAREEKPLQSSDATLSKNADTNDITENFRPVDDIHSEDPQGGALLQSDSDVGASDQVDISSSGSSDERVYLQKDPAEVTSSEDSKGQAPNRLSARHYRVE